MDEKQAEQIIQYLKDTQDLLKENQIIQRVNNLLLSRFILKLDKTRIELGLPKRVFFFKYDLLEDEYNELVTQFGKDEVNKALYRLDRLLLLNKQCCPSNIKNYISKRLKDNINARNMRNLHKNYDKEED